MRRGPSATLRKERAGRALRRGVLRDHVPIGWHYSSRRRVTAVKIFDVEILRGTLGRASKCVERAPNRLLNERSIVLLSNAPRLRAIGALLPGGMAGVVSLFDVLKSIRRGLNDVLPFRNGDVLLVFQILAVFAQEAMVEAPGFAAALLAPVVDEDLPSHSRTRRALTAAGIYDI